MPEESAPRLRPASPLAIVNWSYADGSIVSSHPLQVHVAEAVARAYLERYPDRQTWLSVPGPLLTTGRRIRRR